MTSDILLFDAPGSPCARRVKITLLEKGIAYRSHIVDLPNLEQRRADYLAVNPNGLVPTLVHDGFAIWESNAITEYLDDAFADTPLYPLDADQRVAAKRWQALELELAVVFRPLVYARMLGPMVRFAASLDEVMAHARRATDDPTYLAWERRVWELDVLDEHAQQEHATRLWRYLDQIETALASTRYLVGDSFSTADISVFPRVRMYPYAGLHIEPTRYPNVRRWLDELERRPSFRRTRPGQARALSALSRTGLLSLIQRAATRGSLTLPRWQRAMLALLRPIIRRVLGYAGSRNRARQRPLARPLPGVRPERPAWFGPCLPGPVLRLCGAPDDVDTCAVRDACARLGVPVDFDATDESVALHDGAVTVTGPLPIVERASLRAQQQHMIGANAERRARVRMWCAFERGLRRSALPSLDDDAWRAAVRTKLALLDAHLRDHPTVCGGLEQTFADIALRARVRAHASEDAIWRPTDFPHVTRWLQDLETDHEQVKTA